VIILNAGIISRIGPSRFAVEMARFLARAGHRVLRFDLSGIGDSVSVAEEGGLALAVERDIRDAIELMDGGAGVVLLGLCSGADNAFFMGAQDDRVRGLVLVDPEIHPTVGYHVRHLARRLTSARFWWSLFSGRAFSRRFRRPLAPEGARPPGFFGLLTLPADGAVAAARTMSVRGVEILYVLTSGVARYCNYPGQVAASLRPGIAESQIQVEWRPDADHMLTRPADRAWLQERVLLWLGRFGVLALAGHPRGDRDDVTPGLGRAAQDGM